MSTAQETIAELEKEVYEKQEKLNALRRETLAEDVRDYELSTGSGTVRLSELFGDKEDLIVIHNMGASCPYCTLWADGFNGMLGHFEDRAATVLISPDTPDQQKKFADARGWKFRMVSNGDSNFTEDMGYVREWEGKASAWPGFSTFHRDQDGKIRRIAHASFGPGDTYCGIWQMFGLLKEGANKWEPKFAYE